MSIIAESALTSYSPPEVVGKWSCTPDAETIRTAAKLLNEMRGKEQVILDPTSEPRPYVASIFRSHEYAHYELIKAGQISEEPNKRQRGGSVHKVGFGHLVVRNGDRKPKTISVAIKPFDKPDKAYTELYNTCVIRSRGIPTIRPIGAILGDTDSFFLSIAEEVQTLDIEPWHQIHDYGKPEVQRHFEGRLEQMSRTLADLNTRGIRHGDPQFKNFWVRPTGRIEAIDFESSQLFDNPPSAQDLVTCARKDLTGLYKSTTSSNPDFPTQVLQGGDSIQISQFRRLLMVPYVDQVLAGYPNLESHEDIVDALAEIEDYFSQPPKV